jgi:glycosyltransferase involved in cell wall biosynthesis
MSQPFFSVVIPVYNRAHLVMPSLQSVISQSVADFECIIVDDGSKDSAALKAVIEGLGDKRFHYIWQPNGGGGAARNTGIQNAKGKYIALLDSDDEFLPGKLAQDFDYLKGSAQNDCAVFCQVLVDRGVGKLWAKPARGPKPHENIAEYLTCYQGFVPTSSLVVKREIALAVGYDANLPFGQDTDFAMRLAAAGTQFAMLEKPLVRVSDDARTDRISLQRKYIPSMEWTDRIRSSITPRAYLAYRGWHVARLAAPFDKSLALRLYSKALFSGAFPPALALKAFLQIAFPRQLYRNIANTVVRLLGRR